MSDQDFDKVRDFYNEKYYGKSSAAHPAGLAWHYGVIARRLGDLRGRNVLDVACGEGAWLRLLKGQGANVAGADISARAIDVCRQRMPDDEFSVSTAESLEFADRRFDLVTCLGSLEHFLDKPAALREMVRVSRDDARILLLVPNAGFLTRRLGLYGGTQQTQIREDVWPLSQWQALFEQAGLHVEQRWRDLHPLSRSWIRQGSPLGWPLRAAQALALAVWPISWQYQVHHLCRIVRR
jgi:SAM-dependent methyltransferase